LIDAVDHPAMRAEVDEKTEKDHESDSDPGFSFEHQRNPIA
jgi:hypothetical protein